MNIKKLSQEYNGLRWITDPHELERAKYALSMCKAYTGNNVCLA